MLLQHEGVVTHQRVASDPEEDPGSCETHADRESLPTKPSKLTPRPSPVRNRPRPIRPQEKCSPPRRTKMPPKTVVKPRIVSPITTIRTGGLSRYGAMKSRYTVVMLISVLSTSSPARRHAEESTARITASRWRI